MDVNANRRALGKPMVRINSWSCVNNGNRRWIIGFGENGNRIKTEDLISFDMTGSHAETASTTYILGEPGPRRGHSLELK